MSLFPTGEVPLFTSCDAMELAVIGHSPKDGLDLPVNLFYVLHALRLECVKSILWIASSHRVRLLLSSFVIRELAARSFALPEQP